MTWDKFFYLLDGNGITVDDKVYLEEILEHLFGVNLENEVESVELKP